MMMEADDLAVAVTQGKHFGVIDEVYEVVCVH
jgi:hypothetical protein